MLLGSPSTKTEKLGPRVFLANRQKLPPVFTAAQNSGLAGANGGMLRNIGERHHAIADLSGSLLHGERLH